MKMLDLNLIPSMTKKIMIVFKVRKKNIRKDKVCYALFLFA